MKKRIPVIIKFAFSEDNTKSSATNITSGDHKIPTITQLVPNPNELVIPIPRAASDIKQQADVSCQNKKDTVVGENASNARKQCPELYEKPVEPIYGSQPTLRLHGGAKPPKHVFTHASSDPVPPKRNENSDSRGNKCSDRLGSLTGSTQTKTKPSEMAASQKTHDNDAIDCDQYKKIDNSKSLDTPSSDDWLDDEGCDEEIRQITGQKDEEEEEKPTFTESITGSSEQLGNKLKPESSVPARRTLQRSPRVEMPSPPLTPTEAEDTSGKEQNISSNESKCNCTDSASVISETENVSEEFPTDLGSPSDIKTNANDINKDGKKDPGKNQECYEMTLKGQGQNDDDKIDIGITGDDCV